MERPDFLLLNDFASKFGPFFIKRAKPPLMNRQESCRKLLLIDLQPLALVKLPDDLCTVKCLSVVMVNLRVVFNKEKDLELPEDSGSHLKVTTYEVQNTSKSEPYKLVLKRFSPRLVEKAVYMCLNNFIFYSTILRTLSFGFRKFSFFVFPVPRSIHPLQETAND